MTAKTITIGESKEIEIPDENLKSIWQTIQEQVCARTGTLYPTYGVFNESVTPMVEHIDAIPTQKDFKLGPAYTIIIPLEYNVIHTFESDHYPILYSFSKNKEH